MLNKGIRIFPYPLEHHPLELIQQTVPAETMAAYSQIHNLRSAIKK